MVKDHSDSERGNPLPPHRLLLSINSKGSFICTIPTQLPQSFRFASHVFQLGDGVVQFLYVLLQLFLRHVRLVTQPCERRRKFSEIARDNYLLFQASQSCATHIYTFVLTAVLGGCATHIYTSVLTAVLGGCATHIYTSVLTAVLGGCAKHIYTSVLTAVLDGCSWS